MKLQALDDLLVHQIQDILSAEHQVKKALPLMAKAAAPPGVQEPPEGDRRADRAAREGLRAHGPARLLQASLDEEKAADKKLTSIAEHGVNDAARKAGMKKAV